MKEDFSYFKSNGAALYLEPLDDTSIDDCAEEAVLLGWDLDMTVIFVFNEVMLVVEHGDSPESIVARYNSTIKCIQGEHKARTPIHPFECGCTDCCVGASRPMTEEEHKEKYGQ